MGADLFESSAFFRALVELASDMVHTDLRTLCLKGPERELIKARFLQGLLCAVSLGYHRELALRGVKPDVIVGHSLGEITSLAAAGVVSPEDAVRMATKRGQLMDEAAAGVEGGMMAVLFVPLATVEQLLDELAAPERIVLANDNADDQAILSGDNEMLDRFARLAEGRQLGKCRRITVAGPWHSPYLGEARRAFEQWVEPIAFHRPSTPIVLNALGREESHPTTIKHLITCQLTSPVYWRECMKRLLAMKVGTLLEVGPGRVLSGLARVNGFRKGAELLNVNNLRGVEAAVEALTPAPTARA
jgi:[acyl-carrier-protein] S-malonyltransferase